MWIFFTIDSICLQTISVLFFIELGSRRIHFVGVKSNADKNWITQQAVDRFGNYTIGEDAYNSWSTTMTVLSARPLMPFSSLKASLSFTFLFRLPMQILPRNVGRGLSGKNEWIIFSSSMLSICDASWSNLLNATTLLALSKYRLADAHSAQYT